MITLLSFLALLTIVVFVHELGHFLVARWCGVKISAFSIGFGKEIVGFNDSHGTRWKLAWIPLGGYVKFVDDANEASVPARANPDAPLPEGAFQGKTVGQRAAVVAAGPIANFLLSITLFATLFMVVGERVLPARVEVVTPGSPAERAGFKSGDVVTAIDGRQISSLDALLRTVSEGGDREHMFLVSRDGRELTIPATPRLIEVIDPLGGKLRIGRLGIEERTAPPIVGMVSDGAPAARAGLKPGDVIKSIDGKDVTSFDDIAKLVSASPNREIVLGVARDGASLTVRVTPRADEVKDGAQTRIVGRIGIGRVEIEGVRRRLGPIDAFARGVRDTWDVVPSTFKFIKDVIVGRQSADQLRGPIGIAEISGRMARRGLTEWLFTVGVISAAIGLFNLFPIPMLDGGHLVFYALESIRRKPLSEGVQEMSFRIGFSLVIMLMLFVIWNDSGIVRQWLSIG